LPQGGDPRLLDSLKTTMPQTSPRRCVEQAGAGRWSLLAEHFDEIDASGRGEVSFQEVMRYLERNRMARGMR